MALILLSTIGSIMSAWLDAFLAPLTKKKNPLVAKGIGVTISFLFTLIFFIFIPAAIFAVIEAPNGWTFLNSIYFCFVTLTTVGFGDFVPGTNGSTISDSRALIGLYRIIIAIWVWIGLALIATLISEVQGLLENVGKAIHMYLKRRKDKRDFSINDGNNDGNNDGEENETRVDSPCNIAENEAP